jgi:DNA (cytosine-5)-methyltransferase 1
MEKSPGNPASDGQHESQASSPGKRTFYSIVDLFAGCGGLSLGFENAGFTPVFVSELDKDAIATYLLNRHHSLGGQRFAENPDLRCNDARELDGKRLEKLADDLASIAEVGFRMDAGARPATGAGSTLDMVAGGPPCQGYSGIGIRRSYSVDRKEIPSNHLYQRMASVIRRLACPGFRGHRDRCHTGTGGQAWDSEGRSAASSSSRL